MENLITPVHPTSWGTLGLAIPSNLNMPVPQNKLPRFGRIRPFGPSGTNYAVVFTYFYLFICDVSCLTFNLTCYPSRWDKMSSHRVKLRVRFLVFSGPLLLLEEEEKISSVRFIGIFHFRKIVSIFWRKVGRTVRRGRGLLCKQTNI